MSTPDMDRRREAIRRTLAQRAAGAPDAGVAAAATLGTWQQMAERIEPVIGARGVDVLFGRSLQLTSKAFPWLAIGGVPGNSASSLASLRACLETREIAVATDTGVALLVTFTELLATLIGDSLTERLLGAVWLNAPAACEQGTV